MSRKNEDALLDCRAARAHCPAFKTFWYRPMSNRKSAFPFLVLVTVWMSAVSTIITTATAALDTPQPAFEVFPTDINLRTSRDRQNVVVRVTEPNGLHRDVTADAKFSFSNGAIAKIEKGVVVPSADGETKLLIEWQGKNAEVPVKVEQAQVDRPISFRLDVMPVFMKAECNRCHGAARGQDGFRLSLWGFDPEGDHYRLTREMAGRRINLAIPEESMLLTKSTGAAPHTGGKLFEKESELAQTL